MENNPLRLEDKNPMPEFNLGTWELLKGAASWLFEHMSPNPTRVVAPSHHHGAAKMLDDHLDVPAQGQFGWDDQGNYISGWED